MRVILITSSMILSFVGDYYYVEPCAKINFILQGENATLARYPECAPFFSGEDPNRHIAVKADVIRRDKVAIGAMINMVFGMSGWLAIAIHAFGVELYVSHKSTCRYHAHLDNQLTWFAIATSHIYRKTDGQVC